MSRDEDRPIEWPVEWEAWVREATERGRGLPALEDGAWRSTWETNMRLLDQQLPHRDRIQAQHARVMAREEARRQERERAHVRAS